MPLQRKEQQEERRTEVARMMRTGMLNTQIQQALDALGIHVSRETVRRDSKIIRKRQMAQITPDALAEDQASLFDDLKRMRQEQWRLFEQSGGDNIDVAREIRRLIETEARIAILMQKESAGASATDGKLEIKINHTFPELAAERAAAADALESAKAKAKRPVVAAVPAALRLTDGSG